MGAFDFSKQPMTQANFDKMVAAIKSAVEGADYDSGWIATPANKVIRHNLGVIPAETKVYSSANSTGDPHASDSFTSCDRTSVTIIGPQAYCRVRINKGSI